MIRSSTTVPRLVNYSGRASDAQGRPVSGVVGVTFAIYKDPYGGAPLWLETQSVTADVKGNFSAQLGATRSEGLPLELFSSGEARWLGVRLNRAEEQSRVLLLSVPYALKAADAQTLGGLPPSAFVLAAAPRDEATGSTGSPAGSSTSPSPSPPTTSNVTTTGGTVNSLPLWTSATNVQNSAVTQTGTGATARIGINTTTPSTTLDVKGGAAVEGLLSLPATSTAAAPKGGTSQALSFTASAFNSGSSSPVNQIFRWKAEPVGNNTATPSGSLNLLYGSGSIVPTETGLQISSKGIFTFAPGQTFPGSGSGTVTSVGFTASAADFTVTGSPVTNNGTLGLSWKKVPTSANTANAIVKRDASGGFSAESISATQLEVAGTIYPGTVSTTGTIFAGAIGLGTYAPSERLDLGNDGNVVISTFPNFDYTPDSVSYNLIGRGPGGVPNKWSIYTAAVGGGFGVPANSLSIWQYPPNQDPGCCLERFTVSPSTHGQAVYPVTIDGSGVLHGLVGATAPNGGTPLSASNNTSSYTLSLTNTAPGGNLLLALSGEVNGGFPLCLINGNADLICSGSKSAVVPVDAGARKVALYAVESPENWFEDFGNGRLSNGEAVIDLEPTFAQTVNTTHGYHVFLTPRGDCEGLYVSNVNSRSFTVRELRRGLSAVEFDFRIVARRKGYENIRLADKTNVVNVKPNRGDIKSLNPQTVAQDGK